MGEILDSCNGRKEGGGACNMMSENEVRKLQQRLTAHLTEVQKRFDRYDNHDDLELIENLEAKISTLNKVLIGGTKGE